MMKYTFTINGTEYKALFTKIAEVERFMEENIEDGSVIFITECISVTPFEVMGDCDFAEPYIYELVAAELMPDRHFEKWTHAEDALRIHYPWLFD